MPPLVLADKILKKIGVTGKILGESGGQTFKGSDQEKCQFLYSGNFQHQVFAIFGEEDQQTKLVRSLRKKFMITEEKLGKITTS